MKRLQQLVVTPMVVLQKKTTNNNIFFDEYSVYHNNEMLLHALISLRQIDDKYDRLEFLQFYISWVSICSVQFWYILAVSVPRKIWKTQFITSPHICLAREGCCFSEADGNILDWWDVWFNSCTFLILKKMKRTYIYFNIYYI